MAIVAGDRGAPFARSQTPLFAASGRDGGAIIEWPAGATTGFVSGPALTLRLLRLEDEARILAAIEEYGQDDDSPMVFFEEELRDDYIAYVKRLEAWVEGREVPEGFVPNTFFVGVVGDQVVGRISIRHELNDFLARLGGHIGYVVVPSHRGKGYATEMMRQALVYCRSLGLERVLLTCDADNPASRRVILKSGGVLDAVVEDPELRVPKERYWIGIGKEIPEMDPVSAS